MQQSSNYHRIIDFFNVERLLAHDTKMDVEIIVKMAPANRDEKRRYLEAERNKVIQESIANGDAAIARPFALSGFDTNDEFVARTDVMLGMFVHGDKVSEDARAIARWHWQTAYKVQLLNKVLRELDRPVRDGIAKDFKDYIGGADDATLSFVIENKRLPAGAGRLRWIGKKADAARYAVHFGMQPHQFNSCFDIVLDSPHLSRAKKGDSWKDKDKKDAIFVLLNKYKAE